MNTYYFPIESSNLGAYFSSGIIAPHNYMSERNKDLQSLCSDYLIFSKLKFTSTSDCSLEIILSEEEIQLLLNSEKNNFFLLGLALPITRIKKIYFYSEEKCKRTISFAESSSFIPERLIELSNKNDNDFIDDNLFLKKGQLATNDFSSKINKYNSFLGGFAFMRLGGDKNSMNYSKNYFSALSYFSSSIQKEFTNARKTIPKLAIDIQDEKYHGIFNEENNQLLNWRNYIFGTDENITSKLKGVVQFSNNTYKQDTVKNNYELYILSILANYGHGQNKAKQTDSLVKAITDDNNQIFHKEAVTLFYGLRNGYRGFNKSYYFNNERQIIKFELNTILDYVEIESIYQFVFNQKKSDEFKYLHDVFPKYTQQINNRKFKTYKILDKYIIYDEKPQTVKGVIENFLEKFYPKNILDSLTVFFSKRILIELTENQKKTLSDDFFESIKEPLKLYIEKEIVSDIIEFYEEDIKNKIEQLENVHNTELKNLNLQKQNFIIEIEKLRINQNEFIKEKENFLKIINSTNPPVNQAKDENLIVSTFNALEPNLSQLNSSMDSFKKENIQSLGVNEIRDNKKTEIVIQNLFNDSENIEIHKFYLEILKLPQLKLIAEKNIGSKGWSKTDPEKLKQQILESILKQKKIF